MKKILCLALSLFLGILFAFRPPTPWKMVSLSLLPWAEQLEPLRCNVSEDLVRSAADALVTSA